MDLAQPLGTSALIQRLKVYKRHHPPTGPRDLEAFPPVVHAYHKVGSLLSHHHRHGRLAPAPPLDAISDPDGDEPPKVLPDRFELLVVADPPSPTGKHSAGAHAHAHSAGRCVVHNLLEDLFRFGARAAAVADHPPAVLAPVAGVRRQYRGFTGPAGR